MAAYRRVYDSSLLQADCQEPAVNRNFRGTGARQPISEPRKQRKPGKRGMSLA